MDAIRTERLTKYYGSVRGIQDVSLAVEQGTFFGFIGPNGAGKSTTIRCLLGLIHPDSGKALVLGREIRKNREEILACTGYLSAETVFYPGMRVREVLAFSARLRGRDCRRTAEELCQRLRLDPGRKTEELSLGNRKKVGIVCALQHDPDLLILDEPTSGLDPLIQRAFFEILRERNRAGATIFLSSHVLSEIQHCCTHAALLRDGQVLRSCPIEDLTRNGARRVSLQGRVPLEGLAGVQDLQAGEDRLNFLYSGPVDRLLAVLTVGEVEDVTITEPDLEETLLHFYGKGEGEP